MHHTLFGCQVRIEYVWVSSNSMDKCEIDYWEVFSFGMADEDFITCFRVNEYGKVVIPSLTFGTKFAAGICVGFLPRN